MKIILAAVAATALAGVAAPALAQSTVSLGYTTLDTDLGYDLGAVTVRGGVKPGPVGLEAEASFGVGDDTIGGVTADLDYSLAAFGTLQAAPTPDVTVFGRLGYGTSEIELDGVSIEDSGPAYGAGVAWHPGGGPNGVRAEYTKYDYDRAEADGWSLSYVRRF